MGDVLGVNDDPRKELIMGKEETTLTQKGTKLDKTDRKPYKRAEHRGPRYK